MSERFEVKDTRKLQLRVFPRYASGGRCWGWQIIKPKQHQTETIYLMASVEAESYTITKESAIRDGLVALRHLLQPELVITQDELESGRVDARLRILEDA